MAATTDLRAYGYTPIVVAPFRSGEAVTPHDTNELTNCSRALWIGTAGTGALKVTTVDGTVLTFASVTAGTLLQIAVKLVWSTGTGVSNIVALY